MLAQRRLRSLGMLGALGATDRNIRLVVRANGVLVGVVGALAGAVLGLAAWLAYRPSVESSSHHVIGAFQLPWNVIGPAMALAVIATYFAAARPARSITKVPIVTALSGRPAPPKRVHRSAIPGVVLIVISAVLFWYTGKQSGGGGAPELVLGFVTLIAAVMLLSPFGLVVLARLGQRAPIAVRLALRDLVRYRARSGSALAAISLGVLIAVLVCVLTAQRYGNVLDYAGPNLASNQVIVYTPNGPVRAAVAAPGGRATEPAGPRREASSPWRRSPTGSRPRSARTTSSSSTRPAPRSCTPRPDAAGPGRCTWPPRSCCRPSGSRLLRSTPRLTSSACGPGCPASPRCSSLTARAPRATSVHGNGPGNGPQTYPCPAGSCLANPVIQEVSALPSGTSAPNTVITEHAIHQLGLQSTTAGWLIQTPNPPTAAQITNARLTAAAAGLTIETKSSAPSSAEILNWATVFGIALALGILAMSIGLIRSETASDLRTLAATGASSLTRRNLTAATAGALALLGAVLGTVAAYVAAIAYSSDNQLDGLSELSSVPTKNLLIILIGMPLVAVVAGWLLAGREPAALGHQPIE